MKLSKEASVGGLLLFGTTTSSFAKLVYELKSYGLEGDLKNFRKPWAMTAVMFLGMSLCLPLAYQSEESNSIKVLGNSSDGGKLDVNALMAELQQSFLISIPAGFDLVATVLMNVGLLSVTASVYQMLRGACMLFAALFAVVFLKRELNGMHFTGIGCAIGGIALVGLSSLLASDSAMSDMGDSGTVLMGMALIVLSQAAQAAQITCEDWLMRTKGVSPLKIVGWEGVYGFIAMVLVMLPAAHMLPGVEGQGLHEDFFDTVKMITESHTLQTVLAVDMVAFLAYNVAGMSVTEHYGGVYRSVLETLRTLFVWLVSLGMFYGLHGQMGEAWTEFSYLQAIGFAVLVAGTMLYGKGNLQRVEEEAAAQPEQQQLQQQQPLAQVQVQEDALAGTVAVATAVETSVNPGMGSTALTSAPLPAFKYPPQHPAGAFDTPSSTPTRALSKAPAATQSAATSTRSSVRTRAMFAAVPRPRVHMRRPCAAPLQRMAPRVAAMAL